MDIPFPKLFSRVELPMAGAAFGIGQICPQKGTPIFPSSDVMETTLLFPPVMVMPSPLSTTPNPALEVILRFLNPLIFMLPLPSVNTPSSLVVILMSSEVLTFVEYSLIIPLSVHRFPRKSEDIVIFFAETSAFLIGEPSLGDLLESSVQVITRFLSGCWYILMTLFINRSVSSSAQAEDTGNVISAGIHRYLNIGFILCFIISNIKNQEIMELMRVKQKLFGG